MIDSKATIRKAKLAGPDSGEAATAENVFREPTIFDRFDFSSGRVGSAVSHTVFANVKHSWNREHPFSLEAGGKFEIGARNSALDTWGVWLKFSYAYDAPHNGATPL